jgi:hypothetical protein
MTLAIELHVNLGHGVVFGIVEVLLDLLGDVLGKTNYELVLSLKYA